MGAHKNGGFIQAYAALQGRFGHSIGSGVFRNPRVERKQNNDQKEDPTRCERGS